MVFRVVLFLFMALGLVGFGTVAWIATRPPAAAITEEAKAPVTKPVLVAARALHAGNLLRPEDIASKELPITGMPSDASPNTPDAQHALAGGMVRRALAQGEILRSDDIMRPGDHGFLAAVLEPGKRAVTIGVDATTGSAGLIWPGDHVDLILTQSIGEAGLPMGHRVAAETVLSNARVIAIDQQIVQGAAPSGSENGGRTVTLEVTQEQAERVSVAMRLGRLSLSVRSAGIAVASADQGSGTTWASDVSSALGNNSPTQGENVLRIFQGAGEVKEFRF